jgi:oligosaccharide repeat unit polymerase
VSDRPRFADGWQKGYAGGREMIYIFIWILVLCISVFFFRKAAGSLSITKINLISLLFYYSLLLSSFIGSLLIVLHRDQSYIIAKIIDPASRQMGFYFVCTIMLLLPLTMWVVAKVFGFQAEREFQQYWAKPIDEAFTTSASEKLFYRTFLLLSCLCLASVIFVVVLTFIRIGTIPIIEAMIHPGIQIGVLRQEAAKAITGPGVYIKNIFALALTPVLSLVTYAFMIKTKRIKWGLLFYLLLMASLFMQIYDLQKAPILFYIASLILLRMFAGVTRLNLKKILFIGLIGGIYLVFTYGAAEVTGTKKLISYYSGPIGRTILTQIAPMYLYIDRYGKIYPYLGTKILPDSILKLYGITEKRSSRVLMEEMFPEKVMAGTAGVLNTLYVGEAYAGFGIAGVIHGTILLGIFIQFLYMVFIRLPKHPVFISLFVYFTINIPRAVVGGFTDILFNPLWIIVTLFVCAPFAFIYGWTYVKVMRQTKLEG